MLSNLIGAYKNGNYQVSIYTDGTKIRETYDELATSFEPEFPESMDVKITNYCDMNCAYCHENSDVNGKAGELLHHKFWNTIRPYTEISIGGGNPLSHPQLAELLNLLNDKQIIANLTVNQQHFEQEYDLLKALEANNLIKGLGVSLTNPTEDFIAKIKTIPNAVLHVINGIVTTEDLDKLSGHDLKVLILGYKKFRRGIDYYSQDVILNQEALYTNLEKLIPEFQVMSFDNLAIKQLEVQRLLTKEQWDSFYMGDDGDFTMYIDLVEEKFAQCSVSDVRYHLTNDIVDMFKTVQKNKYMT